MATLPSPAVRRATPSRSARGCRASPAASPAARAPAAAAPSSAAGVPSGSTATMSNAASVPASTALSGNAGLMPMRIACRRTGISVVAQRGVAGRIVHPDGDRRLQRLRRVGRARQRDGHRRVALRVGIGNLAGPANRARRSRWPGRCDSRPAPGTARDRSAAASVPGRSARPPARRRGSARSPAADTACPARSDRLRDRYPPPCGPARTHRRGTRPSRSAAAGFGPHLDAPGAGRRAGRQRDRQIHRRVAGAGGRGLQEHLAVRPLDRDRARECRPGGRRRRAAAPSPAPSRPAGRCRDRARRRHRSGPGCGSPPRRDPTGRTRRCRGRASCSPRPRTPRRRAAPPAPRRAAAARQSAPTPSASVVVSPRMSLFCASSRSVTPDRGSTSE